MIEASEPQLPVLNLGAQTLLSGTFAVADAGSKRAWQGFANSGGVSARAYQEHRASGKMNTCGHRVRKSHLFVGAKRKIQQDGFPATDGRRYVALTGRRCAPI